MQVDSEVCNDLWQGIAGRLQEIVAVGNYFKPADVRTKPAWSAEGCSASVSVAACEERICEGERCVR